MFCFTGTTCITCTAGNYCPVGATSESACITGYYSLAGASVCTICPAGSYCPDTQTVTACADGEYSGTAESSCTACPAGMLCFSCFILLGQRPQYS